SHAAVVARDLGVPAVVGCGHVPVEPGEPLWVDGSTGEIRRPGARATTSSAAAPVVDDLPPALATLLGWADDLATIDVWANADGAQAAARARRFGARGIGL